MAWQYQRGRGQPQRMKVVAIDGAYHGCTLGAMLATRRAFINEGSLALVADCSLTMPLPQSIDDAAEWEALLAEHGSTVAAIIIEPVMAMAGTRQFPDGFLRVLSSLARAYDIPLIFDEVYCGIGRTGVLCESVSQGASPDIVIFSKCLGGGFPITAIMTTAKIADVFATQPLPFSATAIPSPATCWDAAQLYSFSSTWMPRIATNGSKRRVRACCRRFVTVYPRPTMS